MKKEEKQPSLVEGCFSVIQAVLILVLADSSGEALADGAELLGDLAFVAAGHLADHGAGAVLVVAGVFPADAADALEARAQTVVALELAAAQAAGCHLDVLAVVFADLHRHFDATALEELTGVENCRGPGLGLLAGARCSTANRTFFAQFHRCHLAKIRTASHVHALFGELELAAAGEPGDGAGGTAEESLTACRQVDAEVVRRKESGETSNDAHTGGKEAAQREKGNALTLALVHHLLRIDLMVCRSLLTELIEGETVRAGILSKPPVGMV